MTATIQDKADVVIVGSGAAGLFAALTLAQRNIRSIVLSEKLLGGVCASAWSQVSARCRQRPEALRPAGRRGWGR